MAKLRFKCVTSGMHYNQEFGMWIIREAVFNKHDGPRWEAKWKEYCFGLTQECSQMFDSMTEARAHLNRLVELKG